MTWRIGVDIGGTFTDIAVVDDASRRIGAAKTLTTPRDFVAGVLEALASAMQTYGIAADEVGLLCHATTGVTNPLLGGKGARVGLVATAAFATSWRCVGPRGDLYDLFQDPPDSLMPRRRRFEITERIGVDGQVATPLAETEIDGLIADLRAQRVEAVAVSLLSSASSIPRTSSAWAGGCARRFRTFPSISPPRCCRRSASSSAPARPPCAPMSGRS